MLSAADHRQSEKGNALFLILIAVALFATLAYAVSQSMRWHGGGNVSNETSTIDVAEILNVPNAYRTAVGRMMTDQEIDGGGITANPPSYFYALTAKQIKSNIYHPQGGGMAYPLPPQHMMYPNYNTNTWVFNSEHEVKNIGTTTAIPEESSVELMALLPGLKKSVCEAINKKLGITGMPVTIADTFMNASADPPTYMENGGVNVLGATVDDAQLAGKAEGCFLLNGSTDNYVFYAVILGR